MAPQAARQGERLRQRARRRAAALIAYFDTSAFVKLFVDEPGSEAVSVVWRRAANRVSSRLLYPESRAALALAGRSGRLDAASAAQARGVLERLWADVDRLAVSGPLARRAGDLAERLALRGYDAVHLASFETIATDDTLLVTFDGDLRRAAARFRFPVAPAS